MTFATRPFSSNGRAAPIIEQAYRAIGDEDHPIDHPRCIVASDGHRERRPRSALQLTMRGTPMLKKGLVAAGVAAALLLGACQNQPISNVVDAPLGAPEGVTLDQVRQAIMFAGNKRGWTMRQEVPGRITATHQRSGHMAIVDVLYTTTTFSIVYYQSSELHYNSKEQSIHPTYNRWVEFLAQDIQANAAVLATDVGTHPATGAAPGAIPTVPTPPPASPEPFAAAPDAIPATPGEPTQLPDGGVVVPGTEVAPSSTGTSL